MNGAQSLVRTLVANGVDTCFANPGTSEMHFVAALDEIPGMRCVLGLFEGVVSGAADGYARITGKPAAVLMHCGPGLANGLAGLHNAARARSPILNFVGDLATYHRALNPPLARDTESLASIVSPWVRKVNSADAVGAVAAEAIEICRGQPPQVATVVLPSDVCWSEGGKVAVASPPIPPKTVSENAIREVGTLLRSGEPCLLILGGRALRADGIALAHRLSAKTGVHYRAEQFNALIERGRGRIPIDRISYRLDQGLAELANYRHIILVEAEEPVAFFAYPGKPTTMVPPGCVVHELTKISEDSIDALNRVADLVGARAVSPGITPVPQWDTASTDELSPSGIASVLGTTIPENAIVVDESMTFGRNEWFKFTCDAERHESRPDRKSAPG